MRRLSAALFVVLSLLVIVFAFSIEQRRMIGDDRGWDPGSRALPLGSGGVMLAASLYLVFKETARPVSDRPIASSAARLVALAIGMAFAYLLTFRTVGFIVGTNLLLLTLIFFNQEGDLRLAALPRFAGAAFLGTVFMIAVYTLGRAVTRTLFLTGRRNSSELLRAPVFTASVSLLAVAVVFLAVFVLIRPKVIDKTKRRLMDHVLVSAASTEFLYLVFRQIFLVGLAPGLTSW